MTAGRCSAPVTVFSDASWANLCSARTGFIIGTPDLPFREFHAECTFLCELDFATLLFVSARINNEPVCLFATVPMPRMHQLVTIMRKMHVIRQAVLIDKLVTISRVPGVSNPVDLFIKAFKGRAHDDAAMRLGCLVDN
jgi:hypothetical protein